MLKRCRGHGGVGKKISENICILGSSDSNAYIDTGYSLPQLPGLPLHLGGEASHAPGKCFLLA
jgi:hypothetical protein